MLRPASIVLGIILVVKEGTADARARIYYLILDKMLERKFGLYRLA